MRVQLLHKGGSVTGTQRYAMELYHGLLTAGVDIRLQQPKVFPSDWLAQPLRRAGVDVQAFFNSYPLALDPHPSDLYHLPTQTMATLLLRRFPYPFVVSVLDIIPYLTRHDPVLNTFRHRVDAGFYRLALNALRRADGVIAISEYTKRTLVETLGLKPERITVTYMGVDHQHFRPVTVPDEFREKYGLRRDVQYLLYVGSEDPRKNLRALLWALAILRQSRQDVEFIKIGRAHFDGERQKLLELIDTLDLGRCVHFIDTVDDDELVLFYNAADVVVMPSYYEGFGFPVVEAMACGTPVVTANTSSLPELVGHLSVQFDPNSADELAEALVFQLDHPADPDALRRHASQFNWQRTIRETLAVYHQVLGTQSKAVQPPMPARVG